MNYIVYMIICLLLTVIIECLIAYILKYRKLDLLFVLLVNVLTNPLLNAISLVIASNYGNKVRNISVYYMEIMVVFIEGFIYYKCLDNKKYNPFLLSLLLNVCSYILGMVIFKII